MRILMLNNEFPPLGGGTGTVNRELLKCLADIRGIRIDLVTSAVGRDRTEEMFAERIRIIRLPVNNANIHHSAGRELISYGLHALRVATRLHRTEPYDFSFAWSAVPAGWVAARLERSRGLPYFVRVGGPDIPGFEQRYRWLYPLLTPLIRTIWRRSSAVVAKCRQESDMIQRVDRKTVPKVIWNGVDISAFPTSRPPGPGENLRLVCVGRLIKRKGQADLVEALTRLRAAGIDVSLDLVGTGDEHIAYEKLVARKGVEGRVRFAGYVPRSDIAEHYKTAHVFVLASHNEGMSVSTLEAMAAGLPLVVTRVGGTEELVEEGVNGLTFDDGDIETLVAHIRKLSDDRDMLARMGVASRRKAAQFSWANAANEYIRLFDRFVSVRQAKRGAGKVISDQ